MGAPRVTPETLIQRSQSINRLLAKLTNRPDSFAAPMYPLPSHPTPNHITRMLDDLAALAVAADTPISPTMLGEYGAVVKQLLDLRADLYWWSYPADPFSEYC